MKQHIVISAVGGDRVGMVHELSKASPIAAGASAKAA
jgi:predicted amino acid-binding ACT domain protein